MRKTTRSLFALLCLAAGIASGEVPLAAHQLGELTGIALTSRWQQATADISLPSAIGPFTGGYLYTNRITGLVHQLNYRHTYPAGATTNAVFSEMKAVENQIARAFPGMEPFRERRGRPEYIYGRSAYLPGGDGWVVGIDVEPTCVDGYKPTYRAMLTFWNPRIGREGKE